MVIDPTDPEIPSKRSPSKRYDRPSTHPKDKNGCAINPDRRKRRAERAIEGKNGRLQSARQAKKDRRRRRNEPRPVTELLNR
jgi:hypothetical protein